MTSGEGDTLYRDIKKFKEMPEAVKGASENVEYDAIIIGAGVIGPCVGTQLARQGRKVLIIERDWNEPNRIVGELMQPGGLRALEKLGMIDCVNDIELIETKGYHISFKGETVTVPYPSKSLYLRTKSEDADYLIGSDTVKLRTDSTINLKDWDASETYRGVAFRHGKFISNLRDTVRKEPNVTWLRGTVNKITKDDLNKLDGVICDSITYKGKLIVLCDGIYSKFRKELTQTAPKIESYFISLSLYHCQLPKPNYGHVIINDNHSPVLIYQISPDETRILCCFNGSKLPSQETVINYLKNSVSTNLPKNVNKSFVQSLDNLVNENYKIMPNQFLSAEQNVIPGLLVIGDALNMRHPLTGGGMTVGLSDVALAMKLLAQVPDFSDDAAVLEKLLEFHFERKSLDSVINTLSLLLWKLFDANNKYLSILQRGCFSYFQLGGKCVEDPVSLLSGLNPSPYTLFKHFFLVAFYGILINFQARGIALFPLAIFELVMTLITAVWVFVPVLTQEYLG